MTQPSDKIIEHLNVARATELALVSTLRAHIALTPTGSYRSLLEDHLKETQGHADRVQRRLRELGESRGPLQAGLGVLQAAAGQVLSLSKGPLDMVRGTSGEEKLLRNARDECATEGLEIGVYTGLEHVARAAGDERTAELAVDIRADEERMLERLTAEIPNLAGAAVGAEVEGVPSYDPTTTGAADAARAAGRAGRSAARTADSRARATARQARKVPGVAEAEGEVKGAVASAEDLPISNYDERTAAEIVAELPGLSQIDLGKVDAYERRHENRSTVLSKVDTLRGSEPWPGYDELSVEEIRAALGDRHSDKHRAVRDYERRHKDRAGVIEAAERAPASA